jgi:2-keto-3-deoxy-L-arabinonate dehydratase
MCGCLQQEQNELIMTTATQSPITARFKGVFPVVPTTFTASGELDLASQKRAVDFMIDAGSNGLCILANFSEQFVLSDAEREVLTTTILEHVKDRVPVIVTTTHFSTQICIERSLRAQQGGAAMVMVMPPYHGATIRVPENQTIEFFSRLSDAIKQVSYFKIETPGAASKLRELIRLGGAAVEGPWDGEEAITLMPDLEAGATGAMTGGAYPDGIRKIVDAFAAGKREEAATLYQHWLPLINYENRQSGLLACKSLMQEGGVIACEAPRHPFPAQHPDTRAGLIETARRLDPMVLRWGK